MASVAIEWSPSSLTFVRGPDGALVCSRIRAAADAIIALEGAAGVTCKLTNLSAPVSDLDAVNKAYVDGLFAQHGESYIAAIASSEDSVSPSTGAVVLTGGLGVAKNVHVGSMITATAFAATSDARLKTHIAVATDEAARLACVHAHKYEFVAEPGRQRIGVIAQDLVAAGLKASVFDFNGHYAVDYNALVALLLERVNVLEERIYVLERTATMSPSATQD